MQPSHSEVWGTRHRRSFRKSNQLWLWMGKGLVGQSGRVGRETVSGREQFRGNPATSPRWPMTQILHQQGRILSAANQPIVKTKSSIPSLPGEAWRHFSSCCLSRAYSVSEQVAVTPAGLSAPCFPQSCQSLELQYFSYFHMFAPLFADTESKTAPWSLWL